MKATLLSLLFCSVLAFGQKHNGFVVRIVESNPLGGSIKDMTITPDSIIVTSLYYFGGGKANSVFRSSNAIDNLGYFEKFKQLLAKLNLDDLKESYVNQSIDDGLDFEFTFNINHKTKQTLIHYIRVNDLMNLVAQINNMIPPEFAIHYDEDYLKDVETSDH